MCNIPFVVGLERVFARFFDTKADAKQNGRHENNGRKNSSIFYTPLFQGKLEKMEHKKSVKINHCFC